MTISPASPHTGRRRRFRNKLAKHFSSSVTIIIIHFVQNRCCNTDQKAALNPSNIFLGYPWPRWQVFGRFWKTSPIENPILFSSQQKRYLATVKYYREKNPIKLGGTQRQQNKRSYATMVTLWTNLNARSSQHKEQLPNRTTVQEFNMQWKNHSNRGNF